LNVAFKKKAGAARETKTGLFARKKRNWEDEILV
jgi:hypothetical protein